MIAAVRVVTLWLKDEATTAERWKRRRPQRRRRREDTLGCSGSPTVPAPAQFTPFRVGCQRAVLTRDPVNQG
jgi:hypothetical protein